jgi:hypothetical protein
MVANFLSIEDVCSQTQVEFSNAKEIEAKRYKDIEGDPYIFKEFKYGKVLTLENGIVDSVLVNYNGFSKFFEVKQDNKVLELDPKRYPLIIVYEDGEEVYYKRMILKKVGATYSRVVHTNDHCSFLESFNVEKKVDISNYGGVEDYVSFVRKRLYHLELDEGTFIVKLNKKGILSHLGDEDKIKKFVKRQNLSFKKEKDVKKILDYYSSGI